MAGDDYAALVGEGPPPFLPGGKGGGACSWESGTCWLAASVAQARSPLDQARALSGP